VSEQSSGAVVGGHLTRALRLAYRAGLQERQAVPLHPEVAKVIVPPSWPGPTTAASQQVWDLYITDMFAQYATGKMSLDQAIAWGEKEMQEIYAGRKRRP